MDQPTASDFKKRPAAGRPARRRRASPSTQRERQQTKGLTSSRYRSKFEASVAASLKQRGLAFNYESLPLAYTISAVYTPDFVLPNGVIVETKGLFDSDDKAQHPGLDIRLCFMKADVKLSRAPRSLTYWQWAERHGFLWCEGNIPTAWTNAIQIPKA